MSVPGIGPIIASAMVAAIGTGDAFSKGRDFGAWLGLVPRQISTGDRTILGTGKIVISTSYTLKCSPTQRKF
jgi:transposase